jgi:hypothetical protein
VRGKPHVDLKAQRPVEEEEAPGNQRAHAPPILNYLPFSPQLVEVIPSMSGRGWPRQCSHTHGQPRPLCPLLSGQRRGAPD